MTSEKTRIVTKWHFTSDDKTLYLAEKTSEEVSLGITTSRALYGREAPLQVERWRKSGKPDTTELIPIFSIEEKEIPDWMLPKLYIGGMKAILNSRIGAMTPDKRPKSRAEYLYRANVIIQEWFEK